ncbi:glycoside hydrolase domain-containing protein [Kitasatospora paranensis]|uniref:Glycoside hydrolase domain-containing protein n=1 Tax=Kitasatospora paranensis TaxID=258053 RepID=A0ABW2FU74_9ACTN
MRYLGSAAVGAATLALLLATGGPAAAAAAAGVPPPAGRADHHRAAPPGAGRFDDSPRTYRGPGFDTCTAPSLDAMQAWWDDSAYGAVGIYTSGRQRGCSQPRLTADWVARARAMGWSFMPTHVGRQAPCSTNANKPAHIDPGDAVGQGEEEAAEAVDALRSLGIAQGSPVYLDIEAYPRGDADCSRAVVDFATGWTDGLHEAGYLAGFYSSAESGVADLAAAARDGAGPLPDAVWYARWDDKATTTDGAGALNPDLWTDHGRIHQHHGNVAETHGGVSLTVDRDELDAPVA